MHLNYSQIITHIYKYCFINGLLNTQLSPEAFYSPIRRLRPLFSNLQLTNHKHKCLAVEQKWCVDAIFPPQIQSLTVLKSAMKHHNSLRLYWPMVELTSGKDLYKHSLLLSRSELRGNLCLNKL